MQFGLVKHLVVLRDRQHGRLAFKRTAIGPFFFGFCSPAPGGSDLSSTWCDMSCFTRAQESAETPRSQCKIQNEGNALD